MEQNDSLGAAQISEDNQVTGYQMLSLWPIKAEEKKEKKRTSAGEDVEKLEHLGIAGGNVK